MAAFSALMGESACEERNGGWTDEEIKAAAFKDTFHSSGNDWPNDVKPFISPLTMPDSFWNMLTPEIVAIAKDEDGFWHGFEGPPMLYDEGAWGDGLFHYHLETYPQEIFPECSPKDSLILRPTGDSL